MSEILAILHSRAVSPSRVLTSGDSRDERCRAAACAFPIKRSFFSPSHTRAYILFFHVEFPLHRNYLCSALYTRGALPRPKKCVLYVCVCVCVPRDGIFIASGRKLSVTFTNTSNFVRVPSLPLSPLYRIASFISFLLWESGVKSYTELDAHCSDGRHIQLTENIKRIHNMKRKFYSSLIGFTHM